MTAVGEPLATETVEYAEAANSQSKEGAAERWLVIQVLPVIGMAHEERSAVAAALEVLTKLLGQMLARVLLACHEYSSAKQAVLMVRETNLAPEDILDY